MFLPHHILWEPVTAAICHCCTSDLSMSWKLLWGMDSSLSNSLNPSMLGRPRDPNYSMIDPEPWLALSPSLITSLYFSLSQNGVCTHSVDFSDGRISCSFSRTIAIQNVGQDLNLNNNYFVLQGMHATASATPIASGTPMLSFHTNSNPIATEEQFNIATDSIPVVDNISNANAPVSCQCQITILSC